MSKRRIMSKVRYESEDGEIQLIDIPQELIDKINKDSYNQALEDIFNLAKQNAYDDGVDYSIGLQKLDELITNIRK